MASVEFVPEPEARQVLLWVGVSDNVLMNTRERLSQQTLAVLRNADTGFPSTIRMEDGKSIVVRRIRYRGVGLGYGVLMDRWMTIAAKACISGNYTPGIAHASSVLRAMGLSPIVHLTDQLPTA